MIKATELRIGNRVHVTGLHGDLDMSVSAITGRGSLREDARVIFFKEDNEKVGEFLQHIHPIQITSEILQKCGFEKEANNYSKSGFFYVLGVEFDKPYEQILFVSEGDVVSIASFNFLSFKFLHQLQNLYFALTGLELKVDM